VVPRDIIFSEAEIDQMNKAILQIDIPPEVRRRVEFFSSQFELSETAGVQFEYMTKDTARLSALAWSQVVAADNGRDRLKDLGCQTMNGLSVRNLMTLLIYAKALAYFRGNQIVALDDVRQVLPFVLNDKLSPDLDAPFFALPQNAAFRCDSVSWLRHIFDLSNDEFNRLGLDHNDPVQSLSLEFNKGLEGVSESETRTRIANIERLVGEWTKGRKLYGHLYDDLLNLKYLHQRYTNYLHWLGSQ
jgi:hypothetical protein